MKLGQVGSVGARRSLSFCGKRLILLQHAFVCGKKLYNYDNLEPSERKLVL